MPALTTIGDIFAIDLPCGRVGYAHYVFYHSMMTALVEVKSLVDDGKASIDEVLAAPGKFPPVFVGLNYPVRKKIWRRIGSAPIETFQFPIFRRSITALICGGKAGSYDDWELWDGHVFREIGRLPCSLRSLEFMAVWSHDVVEARISTGLNSLYDQLL